MEELNYNIKTSAKNTIRALGYIQDASAKIYSLSNLVIPIWTGTVNSIGKVVDTYGNSPYLNYGDYRVIIEKCDYDTETSDFRVPDTSLVNLTVGCSSAITAHETVYDHSKLMTVNLLAAISPTFAGWSTNPGTNADMTADNINNITTYGALPLSGVGYITYDIGSVKFIRIALWVQNAGGVGGGGSGIEISMDNGTWESIVSTSGINGGQNRPTGCTAKVRYVRFRVNGAPGGGTSFSSIKVWVGS